MGNLNTAIDNDYYPSAHVKKKRLRRSRSNRAVQHSSSSDLNGTIASLLLIAAIPFGAAHENTWLSLLVILSCVTIWQLLRRGKNPVNASQQSSFQVFSLGLMCVVGYVFVRSFRKLS
ncbi:MAG: hypothetical protein KDD60_11560, partial [Bdellovibrionales bacterium]|nr:hypothetical protein [Bdellovibrionales bacterium]